MIMGVASWGARLDPALFLVPLDDEEEDPADPVAVTVPEPAVAVPEDWPPWTLVPSWEVAVPPRPFPAPAPVFMYCVYY